MPTVSVIIPFYNNISWLREAVESVLSQTYSDYEIIVVNDGSPENVEEFLSFYKGKLRYYYKENGGSSTARNKGIDLAEGKYIAFLDSDDLWLPNKLEVQVEKMEYYNAVWSYCGYETFGTNKSMIYRMNDTEKDEMQRYNSPYIATPCVMIKRCLLTEHPEYRFNPDLWHGEDAYFWLMVNADYPILALRDIMVKVRIRGTNASKRARVQLQARSCIWKLRKENKALLINNAIFIGFCINIIYCHYNNRFPS